MPQSNITWRVHRPAEGFYTSAVRAPNPMPVRTFLPTGYEPNYPYPLVVFLHGQGGSEEQILRLAPRLSRRNYVALSLRGPHSVGRRPGKPGYGWGNDGRLDGQTEEYLFRAVEQTRRTYHIHSERVFLAGVCEGASLAYRFGLTYPDKVGGVIALNGSLPRCGAPLARLRAVRQLRVFMGHGIANSVVPLSLAEQDYRVLSAAGVGVSMETYAATHRLHPHMFRDANRWLMQLITQE